MNIKSNIPGPGTYGPCLTLDKYGKYYFSHMKNSQAAKWSPNKKRFIDETKHKKFIPGPGTYNQSDYSGGLYVLSNTKNEGTIRFVKNFKA